MSEQLVFCSPVLSKYEAHAKRRSSQIFRRHNGKIFKPEVETIRSQWAGLGDPDKREAYLNERKAFVAECREVAIIFL